MIGVAAIKRILNVIQKQDSHTCHMVRLVESYHCLNCAEFLSDFWAMILLSASSCFWSGLFR